jgi:hypothetical protein
MVMTVEPGFGGQSFMKDAARKILPAHRLFRDRAPGLPGGQVHVDGGVNRQSAELCGGLAAEVLVVGSTLWKKSVDVAQEIRVIKALADQGYEYGAGRAKAAIPHDQWVTFATLPTPAGRRLLTAIEAAGIPVIQLRAGRIGGSEGPRECELMIPADCEVAAVERFGRAREQALAQALAATQIRREAAVEARLERGETA